MDQKFRSGDPLSGKPMKQFGEDDPANALPAPPQIDEVVAGAEEALKKGEVQEWRCPCGNSKEGCMEYQLINAIYGEAAANRAFPGDGTRGK